ncbi:bifunctional 4-hydroxy-2-oxoglutarate aldolase/2-dehydro-3-deoxy-phosphogluconate aldolase [Paracoccus luteus]|uniref:bifunctional 4-hydroxy-2-oxoglutarate aldolase/2-dehydro-3-deoxy-phosphogluconate aldolase n=1 Tax=Paracoccus luteus TaxID=2508543 RepID=UPI00106F4B41|nr:bifunctional 4-hydroxy-2-oxoglutarate aldolase/2-dehydro-3-deoxy-phosphogluconate aldolase [Paracoccus luteus]
MTPEHQSARTRALCGLAPVIPVIVLSNPDWAEPLARALVAGGLPVLEVTLRTPAALEAIGIMAQVPGAQVGAGTVLSAADVHRARKAGATFAVSPGLTDALADSCKDAALPLLPGAATATEAMQAADRGYTMLKFFPAEAAGGVAMLKSLGGPLPGLSFCPTGGITADNAAAYLGLPNVACVGGSWIAPETLMAAGDWAGIEARARAAAALRR